ncbi:Asp/Glu racemase [Pseudomonas chlororaphis]|uniref:Maleate isomerase n=1 Tax=Pseudomonas chlororaphis TaxID=587753 RepID=A0AAX3FR10_9PSED|nr:Asp/Glu racemase [Pseudomonas chlororaphis]AZC38696.1 Maleate cis-trans isomerase [Pseudomonas chlororaphis subsp. piscium]AZC45245.1 Maleate cis-trans isomerase [Pseudomonas chlororaphis subsp. piscium]WDG70815.1 Asp/Glu racemase [Pseudomonas chlororaphis]WDH31398.1 Asp/Glu racemase [Pseudomonas chlororaphis]WDH69341.1 Asp/Glu racemase [Pseudomonas chlororaphis]
MKNFRIGQIVPSSNTTMETEIPAMLTARYPLFPEERFSFHSARMRMKNVSHDELKKMDADSDRCALELSDARCDVMAYACLVAIMCQGPGYHSVSQARLAKVVESNDAPTPVLSSAGALIDSIKVLGLNKVAIVTPYMKSLTRQVIDYIEAAGIEVTDAISLEISDNLAVGRLDPMNLVGHADRLNIASADGVVLSACVQMPSLPAIQIVQDRLDLPVLSASVSTVYQILKTLGLKAQVPDAGYLLSGEF